MDDIVLKYLLMSAMILTRWKGGGITPDISSESSYYISVALLCYDILKL